MDVVCGTDLSDAAKKAAEIAGAIARRTGGRLVLALGLELPTVTYVAATGDVILFPNPLPEMNAAKTEVNVRLEEEARRIASLLGVEVAAWLDIGAADSVVLDCAAREKAGLVVVGSHGHRAPVRWILGSTAERITAKSSLPVLVTRGETERMLAWAKKERPLRLLIAADFEESFEPAARFVTTLAGSEGADIHVAHACDLPVGDFGRYPYAPAMPIRRVDLEMSAERELRRHAEAAGLRTNAETLHVLWGKAASAIATFAREGRFDLVVAGTHGRRGLERALLGSVAHGLLRRCAEPVLVVPFGG